ncbi:Hsp70 family protein [Paractinoplanes globisporus]|uniref:Hsp70 family protein n=1 Tax=Paractinoplanes globisporus TaxID=113565 RepID=A0ABW6W3R5_9ACTN|nr:Hsp70 family protein [Actinoplanes globisporus]
MRYGLGIDLGTTHTAAAVLADGRVEVARLGSRRAEIPSLVFVKPDGGLLIGEAAERRGQSEPARLAREFKRRIGDPVPILVGGAPFSAHALTAKLLRHVLDTVTQLQDGPPAAITVTHPANWGPYKREQLDQAIRLADAGPVQMRSEPEAAALQHATARRIANGETVAVYDLGGGTFDVAVLRREGDGFVLLGEPEGIEQLGGIDFDEAVFGHVLGVLGSMADAMDPADPETVAALSRLRRDCVEAKESLSFDTETMIPVALPGLHTRVRLNRSELEGMIAPSLDDTVTATQRALRAAGVPAQQLSAILLAGGSSRIPLVSQLLSTEFQRPVVADPHPEHSIAMGAAWASAVALGGGSPFNGAAVPQPRPETSTLVDLPATGGYSPISTPQRGDAAVAGAAAAGAAAGLSTAPPPPVNGGGPATPTYGSAAPVTPTYGSAAPTYPATPTYGGNAPVSGPPVSGPPISGPPVSGAPVSGAPPVGGAPISPGRGAVSFSRGAAAIPGTTPTPGFGTPPPGSGAPGVPGNGGTNIPWPPPPLPAPPGGGKPGLAKLIGFGALAVALLAGGTTAALVLMNNKDDKTSGATPPVTTTPPVSAAAQEPAQAFPSDTMLIRVDTGPGLPPARQSKVYYFTPGKPERTLLPNTQVGDVLPKWSHSRQQIALTHASADGKKSSIYVMNKDGSDRHLVADDAGGRVAWSADDSKMAFMKRFNGVPQIAVLDLETREIKQLTFSKTSKDDAMWSPDGKTILYWLDKGGIKQIYELQVANPKEPGRRITGPSVGPANDPVYSPDGKQVLFTRELNGNKTSDIWLVNIDGSNPHRVTTNPAREMDPTWSPDGNWFAFVRGEYDKPIIVIAKKDGTDETTLTQGTAREAHPCWF